MIGLVLYTDGEIREIDLDPTRRDVLLGLLDAEETAEISVPSDTGSVVFLIDPYATRDVAPLNVYATLYVFASRRRPFHGVNGTVLLLARNDDGDWADAPEPLVDVFRRLSEIPTT